MGGSGGLSGQTCHEQASAKDGPPAALPAQAQPAPAASPDGRRPQRSGGAQRRPQSELRWVIKAVRITCSSSWRHKTPHSREQEHSREQAQPAQAASPGEEAVRTTIPIVVRCGSSLPRRQGVALYCNLEVWQQPPSTGPWHDSTLFGIG